jgi:hypothetical protein
LSSYRTITIFHQICGSRIRRPTGTGRGKTRTPAPPSCEHAEGSRSTAELHGPPPSKGTTATCKQTDDISAFKTPHDDTTPTPTLSTTLDPWIPQPPAAGAAAGGRGIHGSTASEVGRRGEFTKTPLSTVDGERERPRSEIIDGKRGRTIHRSVEVWGSSVCRILAFYPIDVEFGYVQSIL